jgi:hypothetical protein
MKFKSDIEAQAGFKDAGGDLGSAGQLLSSTGAETNWVDASTVIGGPYLDGGLLILIFSKGNNTIKRCRWD